MKIKEIRIYSLAQYERYISQHTDDAIRLYRGQEEASWDLCSKLYRIVKEINEVENLYSHESQIFSDFKEALKKRGRYSPNQTDWEILSIGQHYGLPTRLIDWSFNPHIALWFAFERLKSNDNDRVVWGLVVDELNLADFQNESPFNGRFIKVFQPSEINERIIAQESWFSVQNMSIHRKRSGDGLARINNYNMMNQNEDFEYELVKMIFPNDLRNDILVELNNKMGINYGFIFPDLVGDCRSIEWSLFNKKF